MCVWSGRWLGKDNWYDLVCKGNKSFDVASVFIAVVSYKSWGGLKGGEKENGYTLVWQSTRNVISLPLRDLKAQIEALKTVEDKPTRQTDQPTYEVYTRTEAAKFAHLSKVCCPQRDGYAQVCVWLWHIDKLFHSSVKLKRDWHA